MNQATFIRSWICNNEEDVKRTMGFEPECLLCEKKIETKGQVIMYGNIKFNEYCSDCIQYCNICNSLPDPGVMVEGEYTAKIFCKTCYDKL